MAKLRKVKLARLHTPITIIEYGQLGGAHAINDHAPQGVKPGIELFQTDEGLLIKGYGGKGGFEVLVPIANVSLIQYPYVKPGLEETKTQE